MADRKIYDVKKTEAGWEGIARGGERASVTGPTKAEVVKRTTEIAKNSPMDTSVVIRKQDGKIQEERTFPRSSDPTSSKG